MSDNKKDAGKEKPIEKVRELESEDLDKVSGGIPGHKPVPNIPVDN